MMWGVAAIGFFSGIISGMGIGGGTILIPALLFLTEVNQQQAQGVKWEDLPEDFACELCGVGKDEFTAEA